MDRETGERIVSEAVRCVERLVRDYGERAYQFAYRLAGNADEAQDLVQEAYRRVLARWDQYDPKQPLENWFFAILRHLFLDGARRYERAHVVSMDGPFNGGFSRDGAVSDGLSDGAESVENILARRETVGAVRNALARLSYEHRAVLTLCDMEGMGYHEMASVLGCPPGTVRSRVSRARAALKRMMMQSLREDAEHLVGK